MRRLRFITTRFITLNALLVAASLLLGADIVWELTRPFPSESTPRGSAASRAAAPTDLAVAPSVVSSSVIVGRNLFSPTRSDSPSAVVAAAAPLLKPNLYGVVLGTDNALAYMEDPATKRVTGYRVGDAIAGGVLRAIDAEHIVIDLRGARLDIPLHDASRPRPAVVGVSVAPDAAEAGDRLAQASTPEPLPSTPGASAPQSPVIVPRMMPATRSFRSPYLR